MASQENVDRAAEFMSQFMTDPEKTDFRSSVIDSIKKKSLPKGVPPPGHAMYWLVELIQEALDLDAELEGKLLELDLLAMNTGHHVYKDFIR